MTVGGVQQLVCRPAECSFSSPWGGEAEAAEQSAELRVIVQSLGGQSHSIAVSSIATVADLRRCVGVPAEVAWVTCGARRLAEDSPLCACGVRDHSIVRFVPRLRGGMPKNSRLALGKVSAAICSGKVDELEHAIQAAIAAGVSSEDLAEAQQLLRRKIKMRTAREQAARFERDAAHRQTLKTQLRKALAGRDRAALTETLAECVELGVLTKPRALEIYKGWVELRAPPACVEAPVSARESARQPAEAAARRPRSADPQEARSAPRESPGAEREASRAKLSPGPQAADGGTRRPRSADPSARGGERLQPLSGVPSAEVRRAMAELEREAQEVPLARREALAEARREALARAPEGLGKERWATVRAGAPTLPPRRERRLRTVAVCVHAFFSMWLVRLRRRVLIVDRGAATSRLGWSHLEGPRVVTRTAGRDWKALLRDCFLELGVSEWQLSRHAMLLTEAAGPRERETDRYDLAIDVFSGVGAASVCLAKTAVLSLFSSGKRTGLVIDLGAQISQVVPVYEGQVLHSAVRLWEITGDVLDEHALSTLRGVSSEKQPKQAARAVKEKCRIALHFKAEVAAAAEAPAESHLGSALSIFDMAQEDVLRIPEVYFKPEMCGRAAARPLQHVVAEAIGACDPHVRHQMSRGIVLAGGGTLFPGFEERLRMELACVLGDSLDIGISEVDGHQDNMSAYRGALMFARSPGFFDMCFTKAEFEDPEAVIASGDMLERMFW